MFQYAAARAIALQKDTSLILDISAFEKYDLHQGFQLNEIFECDPNIARKQDLKRLLGWQRFNLAKFVLNRRFFKKLLPKEFVIEPHFQYWPDFIGVSADSYLVGYWQSEKYFHHFEHQIRSDFKFFLPMNGKNTQLSEEIAKVNSVSLHVRRGDYVSNKANSAIHGLCSIAYYQKAIEYISENVSEPHYFIFSDDISWVKENLHIAHPCIFVENNFGSESYNDMRLMSLCQHNIIANSSFSWWGAWLNKNKNKIVVAPRKWFANDNVIDDLIPQSWKVL